MHSTDGIAVSVDYSVAYKDLLATSVTFNGHTTTGTAHVRVESVSLNLASAVRGASVTAHLSPEQVLDLITRLFKVYDQLDAGENLDPSEKTR